MQTVVLPDGERHKTLATFGSIVDRLVDSRFHRDSCLVALGGGVVGDVTGYAAASFQRGVDFMQVPTTLLAQVDSSVGGKTAVNHPRAKNMIGAFHQPIAVLADTDTLKTLPPRELRGRPRRGDQVRRDRRRGVLRVARERHDASSARSTPRRSLTRSAAAARSKPRSSPRTSASTGGARC